MSELSLTRRTFRYPTMKVIQLSGAAILFSVTFVGATILELIVRRYVDAAFFACMSALFLSFAPGLLLSTATIAMDDVGVSSYLFGIRTQHYLWSDIVCIRKAKLIYRPSRNREYVDIVKDDRRSNWLLRNAVGVIRATDYIKNYKAMIEHINQYADAHSIDRRVVDEESLNSASVGERSALANGASVQKL